MAPGGHSAAGPLPSLSEPHTISPDSSEPRRAPTSLWARQGFGERAGGVLGGQAEACPLKGTSTLYTCPHPPPPQHLPSPRIPLRRTATGDHRGEVRGKGWSEREKILEEEGLHSLTHSFCAYSPTHCSIATAILEAGGLGQRQGVEATGASVSPECWGQMGWWGSRGGGTLSQSLFPCRLSPPMPAAHPILKAHGSQTSPPPALS